jgi:hypothetical protein
MSTSTTSNTNYTGWQVVKTRLLPDEREWLEAEAKRDGRSIASILRRLVREARDEAAA